VSTFHRVDVAELSGLWSQSTPKVALTKQLLKAAYLNREPVNEKVSRIKMTDAFLVRAFITFAMLLVIQAGWKPVADGVAALTARQGTAKQSALHSEVCKPLPRGTTVPIKSPENDKVSSDASAVSSAIHQASSALQSSTSRQAPAHIDPRRHVGPE